MLLSDLVRSFGGKTSVQDTAERRFTTKLFNYWEGLRAQGSYPTRDDFDLEDVPGLRDNGFGLNLNRPIGPAAFDFVGNRLIAHTGIDPTGQPIDKTPADTPLGVALTRIDEVLQYKAPVTFDFDVVDSDERRFLCRVALLPFGNERGETDYILGAVTYTDKLSETTSASLPPDAYRDDVEPEVLEREGIDDEGAAPPQGFGIGHNALAGSLDECRALAAAFAANESTSRITLYQTLEGTYRLYFLVSDNPDGFAALCDEAGVKLRPGAAFTALVKLVFGPDYDKTRISEYAACLAYAERIGRQPDGLQTLIEATEGGIKGCVRAERDFRRREHGTGEDKLHSAKTLLRDLQPVTEISANVAGDDEFVLLLARRRHGDSGKLQVLCPLDEKPTVVESILKRAARGLGAETGTRAETPTDRPDDGCGRPLYE